MGEVSRYSIAMNYCDGAERVEGDSRTHSPRLGPVEREKIFLASHQTVDSPRFLRVIGSTRRLLDTASAQEGPNAVLAGVSSMNVPQSCTGSKRG